MLSGRVVVTVGVVVLALSAACSEDDGARCMREVEQRQAAAKAEGQPDPYDGVIPQAVCFR